MIDMNLFATQITAGGNAKGLLNGQALGGNGLFGITPNGGIDFLSALLGNVETEGESATNTNANNSDSTNTLKTEKADLALIKLALLGQDPDKSLEEKLGELKIEQLANTKENRVAQLTKLIEHLTSGLPENALDNGTIEQLVNRLEKRLNTLEANMEALRTGQFEGDEAPFKALIATGLNPAQLTKITERIQEVENKLGRELTVEDLIAGVGSILPVSEKDEAEFATTDALAILINQSQKNNEEQQLLLEKKLQQEKQEAIQSEGLPLPDGAVESFAPITNGTKTNAANENASNKAQDVINALNANQIPAAGKGAPIAGSQSNGQTTDPANMPLPLATEEIAQRLSNGEYQAIFGSAKKAMAAQSNMNTNSVAAALNGNAQAVQKVESLLSFNFSDALASVGSFEDSFGFDIQTGMPFNTSMQAASFSSNNVVAGQTHPATQMVAAHITKSAQSGETKQMTLQLDPPELGRVEVRLEFGDERMVKANIVVEKPETLLMLQRDAQASQVWKLMQDLLISPWLMMVMPLILIAKATAEMAEQAVDQTMTPKAKK